MVVSSDLWVEAQGALHQFEAQLRVAVHKPLTKEKGEGKRLYR